MSSPTLPLHQDDSGVVTLTLRQEGRPVVVLDWALLRAIDAALIETAAMKPAGFVLASDSRVFIAGANLEEIMELTDDRLHEYLSFGQRVFGRIAELPCASVAAINGVVLGGGLEIAMHCDHLIGVQPYQTRPDKPAAPYMVGLPEAGLSICPGWGGTNMLPARIEPLKAITMTATGQTFNNLDAHAAGLLEELVPTLDSLLPRARELARTRKKAIRKPGEPLNISNAGRSSEVTEALKAARGNLPASGSASAVLACVEAGLNSGWKAALDLERQHLVDLRNSPAGRDAIKAFFERSKAR